LWATSGLIVAAALVEPVDLIGPAAVLDYSSPTEADPAWVPVVEFEAATLIVVAGAVVQPAAGAAFVSAVEVAVVTGPVLWVT
jgi:hypothetical protein